MPGKELPYFMIGDSYGGNQSWFLDPWMHIGGCGALTMCDFLLYMACCKGNEDCYPYDPGKLTRRDYRRFGMSVKPYLRPRESGIKDIDTFVDGARIYLEDCEIDGIEIGSVDGNCPYEEAEAAVRGCIDSGMPLAMLVLRHKDERFSFFEWHWFLINGYDDSEDFSIKVATYGKAHWLPLHELWDNGQEEKGGLVTFSKTAGE